MDSAYFIGIGGIGMSALARYLRANGWRVEGSDDRKSSVTDELIKEGLKVKIGQNRGNIGPKKRFSMVIYNRAIREDNPEFVAARKEGLPLIPYAEALGRVTEDHETIAITGSHGKSTTTALAAVMLMRAGFDPTVLVGTKLADLGGKNMRIGRRAHAGKKYLVLEADDYQAAFLHYSPSIAVVTNIDREHMDFYKNFANVKRAFLKFLARTREGGTLILNWDDRPLRSLRTGIESIADRRKLKVIWYSRSMPSAKRIRKASPLPGPHNLSNAAAVFALGRALRIPEAKILPALASYRGAWRRMEYRGKAEIGGVSVKIFDDYAHHPSEIKATIAAFREKFPKAPLLVAFQPHQAKRLQALFKEFTVAFDGADATWITPIYKVPGRDERTRFDSAALVRAMLRRSRDHMNFYLEDPLLLPEALRELLAAPLFKKRKQATLVMMGAGDIVDHTNIFFKKSK